MQFWPRKRAKRIYPSINWTSIKADDTKPLGFGAWKVGMTHIQLTDNNQKSSTFGKIIFKPVTVLESPSLFVFGIRFYSKDISGLRVLNEKWAENIPKDIELNRKTIQQKKKHEPKDFVDIRLLVSSQPKKSGMKKKRPEIFELGLGGTTEKKMLYAESVLGKELSIKDVFRQGEIIDVSGVTKGHGFTGPVKRFGIRIQTRKDKQMHRHTGSVGPTVPRKLDWRVPLPGQYGFHTRTEFNKRILVIEDDPSKINVKGGYLRYGNVKSTYALVEGSLPGSTKRFLILRKPTRVNKKEFPVDIKYISLESKQGT